MSQKSAFSAAEIALALFGALIVQGAFLTLLVFFGDSRGLSKKEKVDEVKEIPIAVQPVLDDRPLLKLGSKVKPKLPQMWQKREPVPVKRYEERSAPSEEAQDDPDKIPESELADLEHEAPPEDAELIDKTDLDLEDPEEETEEVEMNEEGEADGSEHGTETDPLKARAVDKYRAQVLGWFNARFRPPTDMIPCDVLKGLSAGVTVQVGGSREITGFSIVSPSGNATFDGRVNSTLQGLVGQRLPPPPPLYPDILQSVITPRLSGAHANCKSSAPKPSPAAPAPESEPAAPEAPAPPAEPSPQPAAPSPAPAAPSPAPAPVPEAAGNPE